MAIVETLEIRFQADLGKLGGQLKQLSTQILGLGSALDAGRMNLSASAQGLIQAVASALQTGSVMSAAPQSAGSLMAARFASAIASGSGAAASAASGVCAAAKFSNSGAVSGAHSAGYNLSLGFAGGIRAGKSAVINAVNSVVSAALARFRSALRIHSPSRVSFELGGYFGQGFADGVRESVRTARQSAADLASGAASALNVQVGSMDVSLPDTAGMAGMMRNAVSQALGDTSIVIPLHVDGMKLGEASIRGINRVTRASGRLMLDI